MINKLNNKGQSLVMFVCLIPMILIIILLVIDYGKINTEKQKLDSINKLAIEYLQKNGNNTDSISKVSDIITKNDSKIQNIKVDTIEKNNTTTITLQKEVGSVFGKIINTFKYDVVSIYELNGDKIKRIK